MVLIIQCSIAPWCWVERLASSSPAVSAGNTQTGPVKKDRKGTSSGTLRAAGQPGTPCPRKARRKLERAPPPPGTTFWCRILAGVRKFMLNRQQKVVLPHLCRLIGPPPGGDLSDRDLLERFLGRCDAAAFAVLVRRHGPTVLGVCRRVLR